MPQVVVLPATAEEVSQIVQLANRERIPVVPRAGGTGLVDGAVPLHHGILVDIKRMDRVFEIDLAERTVTVGPGVNMLKLNEVLRPHGVMYPDNPASYSCALVGGRIGTNGWSLLGSRFGHVRQLVISFEIVLPTGEIIRVGEGGGVKTRSSSSGYRLKELFMGAQGTLGIVTQATLELVKRPEAEFSAFWMQRSFDAAWRTGGELMRSGLRDHRRRDAVRRAQGRLPAPRRRGVHPAARLGDGGGGVRAVRQPGGGAARRQGDDAHREGVGRRVRRRRDRAARLVGPARPLRDAAARADAERPGGADVVALRGRGDPVSEGARDPRALARDRRPPGRAASGVRRLGHVRLHQRAEQAVGRRAVRDRRRHLGAGARRRDVGRLGRREARHRARLAGGRRLDLRRARLGAGRRGRPRAAGAGWRLRRDADDQARCSTRTTS